MFEKTTAYNQDCSETRPDFILPGPSLPSTNHYLIPPQLGGSVPNIIQEFTVFQLEGNGNVSFNWEFKDQTVDLVNNW